MTIEELKEFFKAFLRDSAEDVCNKCAYCTRMHCTKRIWVIDDAGNTEAGSYECFPSDCCVEGLYEYYKASKE